MVIRIAGNLLLVIAFFLPWIDFDIPLSNISLSLLEVTLESESFNDLLVLLQYLKLNSNVWDFSFLKLLWLIPFLGISSIIFFKFPTVSEFLTAINILTVFAVYLISGYAYYVVLGLDSWHFIEFWGSGFGLSFIGFIVCYISLKFDIPVLHSHGNISVQNSGNSKTAPNFEKVPDILSKPESEIKYYFIKEGHKIGPVTLAEIKIENIEKTTLIWKPGLSDWIEAHSLNEFQDCFQSLPPPVPTTNPSVPFSAKRKRKFMLKFLVAIILIGAALSLYFIIVELANSGKLGFNN